MRLPYGFTILESHKRSYNGGSWRFTIISWHHPKSITWRFVLRFTWEPLHRHYGADFVPPRNPIRFRRQKVVQPGWGLHIGRASLTYSSQNHMWRKAQ